MMEDEAADHAGQQHDDLDEHQRRRGQLHGDAQAILDASDHW